MRRVSSNEMHYFVEMLKHFVPGIADAYAVWQRVETGELTPEEGASQVRGIVQRERLREMEQRREEIDARIGAFFKGTFVKEARRKGVL